MNLRKKKPVKPGKNPIDTTKKVRRGVYFILLYRFFVLYRGTRFYFIPIFFSEEPETVMNRRNSSSRACAKNLEVDEVFSVD